jgi:phospholipid/cholesterol/gamma-HCH transport system substrate-binding protein
MKKWPWLFIVALAVLMITYLRFGTPPSFLRKTYPVYLKSATATGIEVGTPVDIFGIEIGFVKDVVLTVEGDVTIELAIYDQYKIPKHYICVLHRLHRYDTTKLHVEPTMEPPDDLGTVEAGATMRSI